MTEPRETAAAESTRRAQLTSWRAPLGVVVGLAGALVVTLVAMAIVFSIARGTSDVATVGTAAIYEEASLSAAAATRNRTVQAQLIAEASAQGITDDEALAQSLTRAEEAAAELAARIDRLTDELEAGVASRQITAAAEAFTTTVTDITGRIRDGDTVGAAVAIDSNLEATYGSLIDLLADERDIAISYIAISRDDAGRLADAARFAVVLLVPLLVLIGYRARVRRIQRRNRMEQQLEKERAVTKTKDEFIANLSHELRTPLTGIYGFALELIDGNADHDPELSKELAKLIATESADLTRMVEDLLTAATDADRIVVALTEVDPTAEVAEVLAPLSALGVHIASDMEPGTITADQLRFRQIIRNLVSNAHRYGGPNITVVGRAEEIHYEVEVRDDGAGVPAEIENRLFTRFIHEGTAPLTTGSVGLGLSIAQLLAERTGGTIGYRRENGETVFAVTYPRVAARLPS